MSNKTRVGIIGMGKISEIKHVPFYVNETDEAEIVAVCDLDEKRLDYMCDKFSLNNVARYTDFRKMLERDDLDAVDICLHNNYHAAVTVEVLKAGKHAYCEKPIAGTYADGKAMVDMAKQVGKRLHIQLARIYLPETKIAKSFYDSNILGEVYHVRSVGHRRRGRPYVDGYAQPEFVNSYHSGGGAFFDMGVYHISQLLYILGLPKIKSMFGNTYQKTDMYKHRKEISRYDVEEFGSGYVKFENDLSMDILEIWACHMGQMQGSAIYGSKGGITFEPFKFYNTICDVEMDSTPDVKNWKYRQEKCFDNYYNYSGSMEHWVTVLNGKCNQLPTPEIALQTMIIQEGIYYSEKRGEMITSDEVIETSKSKAIKL